MPEAAAVITSSEADREPNARLALEIRRFRSEGAREVAALTLCGPFGETFGSLTASARQALEAALTRLAEAEEVMLGSRETELSPETAAKVLGVSRLVVYHRKDAGRLPYRKVGSHRRVL